MAQLTNYIDKNSYFQDMHIIEERLKRLEHLIDVITRKEVEALSDKETSRRKKKYTKENN